MTCFLWNTNCPLTLQGTASSHVHHNTPKHGQLIHLHFILQGKLSINTRIIAKLYPCFYVHCFCPGFATVDMTSNNGILSFETIRRETMVFPFLINGRNFLGGFSPYFRGFFFPYSGRMVNVSACFGKLHVCPGFIRTDMTDHSRAQSTKQMGPSCKSPKPT